MAFMSGLRVLGAVLGAAALCLSSMPVMAQSGGAGNDKSKPAADNSKEGRRQAAEIAEAARLLPGPAGRPECVWLGRRVVSLLWRDDLDTAFRHLDLYDRFGCPSAHIQATFRCLIQQGHIDPKDPKAPETLNGRVHACWLNPDHAAAASDAAKPAAPAAAAPPADKPAPSAK
jgi:hypothetical protein